MVARMNNKIYTVYMHESPYGKKYIGITSRNPVKRWGHDGYCYRTNVHFYNAIKKYGWDNFKHTILFTHLTKEEAEKKEIELIAYYKTTDQECGYNIENGGNSIGKHSEETKKKIARSRIGKRHSEEAKKKMSEHRKGHKAWNKGLHMTDEEKFNDAMKQKRKPVICVETNVYYLSLSDAGRKTGIDISSIMRACKGKVPRAGGYHWTYWNEVSEDELQVPEESDENKR